MSKTKLAINLSGLEITPADRLYYSRIETLFDEINPGEFNSFELNFVHSLYLAGCQKYSDNQRKVINRIYHKFFN